MTSGRPNLRPSICAIAGVLVGVVSTAAVVLLFAFCDSLATGWMLLVWQHARWALFVMMPLFWALVLWLRRNVFPESGGSGVPQTIAALEAAADPARERCLGLPAIAGKLLLTIVGLFGLFSIGREGPSVQAGAGLMRWAGRKWGATGMVRERNLILAGAAAGLAAAFNTPLAGIVFAVEELGRGNVRRYLVPVVLTVALVCVLCGWVLGDYFSFARVAGSELLPSGYACSALWLSAAAVGSIAGLAGALFARIVLRVLPEFSRAAFRHPVRVGLVCGLVCALLALWSDGSTLGTGHLQSRALIFGRGMSNGACAVSSEIDAEVYSRIGPWYALQRAGATLLVLTTGTPGGLFDPAFSCGAGLGNILARWLPFGGVAPSAVVLLSIAAFFTGLARSPLTAVVMLVEMTGAWEFLPPLVLAAFIARFASIWVCPQPFYSRLAGMLVEPGAK
ncbi:MAG: chloride channel protein [Chthoniobacterales bacterium]|nr:chloride channel protein [Chthoniobacterales bacterium]